VTRAALLLLALASSGAAAAAAPRWPLTVDGWGPVRIGMSQAQVARVLKTRLTGQAIEDEDTCVEKGSSKYPGVFFMFEGGKVTRVSVSEPSRVRTPSGIGIGATAAEVRRAYPKGLHAETHEYLDRPAEYLTFWTIPNKRGVRFETDLKRRVQVIHAGTGSIQYIEGCA
jgi:hypothetical protein